VITAHNGCLQLEVTVHGRQAHAAIPATGVDALQGANAILNALYAENAAYRQVSSRVAGITHPYSTSARSRAAPHQRRARQGGAASSTADDPRGGSRPRSRPGCGG
jgi:acetylornithine deacetylase/succinyl-diaminopimelate desuccinylase-like protein